MATEVPATVVLHRRQEPAVDELPDPVGRDGMGAELAAGEGRGHIYIVEPSGEFEDDPNVTNKRFPGNPTQSFCTGEPLRLVGELIDRVGHSPEKLQAMRDGLDALQRQGSAQIED